MAAQSDDTAWMEFGHEETLPTADLKIDYNYQRQPSQSRIAKMARDFHPQLVGRLVVNRRDDGELYIIDGQHRHGAMVRLGIKLARCLVFDYLVPEDERWMFHELDSTQKRLSPYQLHHSGGDEAREIDELLAAYGLVLVEKSSAGRVWGKVGCTQTIYAIYRSRYGKNGVALRRVLDVITRVWQGDPAALHNYIIMGLHIFLVKAWAMPNFTEDALIRALRQADPARIVRDSRNKADGLREKCEAMVALVIYDIYNKGKREHQRLPELTISSLTTSERIERRGAKG